MRLEGAEAPGGVEAGRLGFFVPGSAAQRQVALHRTARPVAIARPERRVEGGRLGLDLPERTGIGAVDPAA
jgi:hypothetical protein